MSTRTPVDARPGLPVWAVAITIVLLAVGGLYALANLGGENPAARVPGATPAPVADGPADPATGRQIAEQQQCHACHGGEYEGGIAPGLVGVAEGPQSENLQQLAADHADDWIHLWIDGTGPEVQGLDRGGMPTFGDRLSPEQIEAIVAFLHTLD